MENGERLRQLIEEAVSSAVAKLMEPQSPVLVSRDEAAKRLGVDISTLWRWAKVGYLPVASRIGKHVYYTEESIRRLEAGDPFAQALLTPVKQSLNPYAKRR